MGLDRDGKSRLWLYGLTDVRRLPALTLCVYAMFRGLQELEKAGSSVVSWGARVINSCGCDSITAAGRCRLCRSARYKAAPDKR